MRFFDKYTGFWRRIKAFYSLYNLSQLKHLSAQQAIFKKYGLRRSVILPLHHEIIEKKLPELKEEFGMDDFSEKGFVVLKGAVEESLVDRLNEGIESALANDSLDFNYTGRKIHFAYEKVDAIKEVMHHPAIKEKLEELVGGEVLPFQSINFHYGSEQKAHSDSIHMSTYPEGGLIAAWVALEDITDKNGPLFYYPGSHKWPYVYNKDIGASTGALLSSNPNKLYEEYIEEQLKNSAVEPEVFYAKKGDVLIWHANLLHGGMPHNDMSKTRKSLVVHYFKKDVICYHEISQRVAVVKEIV